MVLIMQSNKLKKLQFTSKYVTVNVNKIFYVKINPTKIFFVLGVMVSKMPLFCDTLPPAVVLYSLLNRLQNLQHAILISYWYKFTSFKRILIHGMKETSFFWKTQTQYKYQKRIIKTCFFYSTEFSSMEDGRHATMARDNAHLLCTYLPRFFKQSSQYDESTHQEGGRKNLVNSLFR